MPNWIECQDATLVKIHPQHRRQRWQRTKKLMIFLAHLSIFFFCNPLRFTSQLPHPLLTILTAIPSCEVIEKQHGFRFVWMLPYMLIYYSFRLASPSCHWSFPSIAFGFKFGKNLPCAHASRNLTRRTLDLWISGRTWTRLQRSCSSLPPARGSKWDTSEARDTKNPFLSACSGVEQLTSTTTPRMTKKNRRKKLREK